MSADLFELRRARPRRSIPIPAGACRIFSDVFGIQLQRYGQTKFVLRRCRAGVEIMLVRGSFSWNITHYEKVNPKSFSEARRWVAAYAARFGDVVEEVLRKPREKQPIGPDRKLFKAGGCSETWLSSDVPALFGEAMMRCRHPGGFCASDGYCHYGDCKMQMVERVPDVEEA